jgi:hypothetical protein
MLEEKIRLSYPWIKIKNQIDELICRLTLAEDQEEAEMFLFRLYLESEEDLMYFEEEERERIKGFLKFLIIDTQRHKEMIGEMMDEIKAIGEVRDGS